MRTVEGGGGGRRGRRRGGGGAVERVEREVVGFGEVEIDLELVRLGLRHCCLNVSGLHEGFVGGEKYHQGVFGGITTRQDFSAAPKGASQALRSHANCLDAVRGSRVKESWLRRRRPPKSRQAFLDLQTTFNPFLQSKLTADLIRQWLYQSTSSVQQLDV